MMEAAWASETSVNVYYTRQNYSSHVGPFKGEWSWGNQLRCCFEFTAFKNPEVSFRISGRIVAPPPHPRLLCSDSFCSPQSFVEPEYHTFGFRHGEVVKSAAGRAKSSLVTYRNLFIATTLGPE